MASDTQRDIDSMQRAMRFFSEDVQKAEKASKGVAENINQLALQLQTQHRTFVEYLATTTKLPKIVQEVSAALVKPAGAFAQAINELSSKLKASEDIFEDYKHSIMSTQLPKEGVEQAYRQLNIYRKQVDANKASIKLEESRLQLRSTLDRITGKQLASEFILAAALTDSIRKSGEINQAIIQANSLTDVRKQLTEDIYAVQAKTGNSFQDMVAGAKALTSIWPKNRADFRSTLETIVMMEEGLGVSYDNSAQLAKVFQINLRTPVREIADQIAIIANNTSLAADEATRFATEIGKAIRMIGPGLSSQTKEVVGYVTMLAGRMKDVNGDANEIVKLFTEMTKGTSQGFMLRGLAGVSSPGALNNRGGTEAAFKGLGRTIDKIVTAAPGTAAYSAQLEAAAQIVGTTTETLILYKKMLEESKKPLDEHAKLEQRWREQVGEANKSLVRVKESFMALIRQALVPVIPYIAKFFNLIASFVSGVASWKPTIYAVTAGLVIAGVVAARSIASLTVSLYNLALASTVAARAQMAAKVAQMPLPGLGGEAGTAKLLSKLGVASQALSKVSLVLGAGLAGASLGTLIDRTMDKIGTKWSLIFFPVLFGIKKASESLGKYFDGVSRHYATVVPAGSGNNKPVWEIMAQIRREALRGNMEGAVKIFEENKYKVAGLKGEKGAQGYLNAFVKTMAEVRERIGVSSVTVEEKKTKAADEKMIDLTKRQVENSGEYLKRVKEIEQRRQAREDADRAAEERQRMIRDASFRMSPDPYNSMLY